MVQSWTCPSKELMARTGIDGTDFSYLTVIAYECKGQMAMARAASVGAVRGDKALARWKLLVSSDITETINHSWGKYESMSGKLQELVDQTAAAVSSGAYIGSGALPLPGKTSPHPLLRQWLRSELNGLLNLLPAMAETGLHSHFLMTLSKVLCR